MSHEQGKRGSGKLCGPPLPALHARALSQHGRHTSSDMPLWRSKYGVLSYCTYRSAMRVFFVDHKQKDFPREKSFCPFIESTLRHAHSAGEGMGKLGRGERGLRA
jgi:hypothetical protein